MGNYNFLNDKKGFYSLYEGIFAILLLFILFIAFNTVLDNPISSLSQDVKNFKTSQDLMEIMVLGISNEDSTLDSIKNTLVSGKNSQNSINQASLIADSFFNENIPNQNYLFREDNVLNGQVISSNGDINNGQNITIVNRNLGEYSFSLLMWD